MRSKLVVIVLSAFAVVRAWVRSRSAWRPTRPRRRSPTRTTWSAIFRSRCGSCHNPDKQKGGLNLDNYGAAMQGGGSGKVIEPGDAESSTLFLVITHKEEPKMPPNSPKIPDAEIELIRKWIEGGALENSGQRGGGQGQAEVRVQARPGVAGQAGRHAGDAREPLDRAVRAPGQAERGRGDGGQPLGAAGRRRRAQAGAALPDDRLPPGRRAAVPRGDDLRPQVQPQRRPAAGRRRPRRPVGPGGRLGRQERARGSSRSARSTTSSWPPTSAPTTARSPWAGPSKVVRVYNTADGSLAFEMRKHTEWITAVEFSPDGVLLATGDRNNGLIVWEAQTGREFFDLRGHQAAITDVSWRLDSNVVASSSEDGTVRLWEMENGGNIKTIGAHGGGVASVRFAKDGRLRHDRPRPRGPALGPERRQAARVRAVRRPGARGRLHPRRVARSSPPTGRARSASGTRRTAGGWRTWRSTPPRSPSASSRRSRPWPRPRPRPTR